MADMTNATPWNVNASQSGKYKFSTAGTYVDRDIQVTIPAGSASVTGKTITKNPTITYDATSKKIKAEYSGSDTVGGSATPGWVSSVSGDTVSTSGSTSVAASTLDSDLVASNIKNGVDILGVTGTLTGASFGTTSRTPGDGSVSATATSATITEKSTEPTSGPYITVTGSGSVSTGTGWVTSGSTSSNTATKYYSLSTTSRSAGAGSTSATVSNGNGVTLGTAQTSAPTSGRYITVTGSGSVSTGTGWITEGSTSSNTKTLYYPVSVSNSSLGSATLDNKATSGKTYTPNSSVIIPSEGSLYINAGYIEDTVISLDQILGGADDTAGTAAADIRTGKTAYDVDGKLLTGTMGNATIASGAGSVTAVTPSYNSTNKNFDVAVSGSVGNATVTSAGYISSSVGTKSGNSSVTSTATLAKIGGTASATANISGGGLSKGTKGTSEGWTNAASSSAAVTSAPTSGVYIKVDRAKATATATPSVTVSTAGYGDATNHGIGTAAAGTKDLNSGSIYVPVATTSRSAGAGSAAATATNATITAQSSQPSSGPYITVTGSGSVSTGDGWVTAGSTSSNTATKYYSIQTTSRSAGAGSAAASVTNGSGVSLGTAQDTAPTSGRYLTVTGSGSVSTGAGWVGSGSTSSNTKTLYYPISVTSATVSGPSLVADSTKNSGYSVIRTSVTAGYVSSATNKDINVYQGTYTIS